MTRFFNFVIDSNLYVSLCAVVLFFFYQSTSQLNFFLSLPCLIFSATFIAYNTLRMLPLLQQNRSPTKFSLFLSENKSFFIFSLLLSFIVLIAGFIQLDFPARVVFVTSGLIVLLYESIFFKFSLRNIPYLKTFLVAIVWANVIVALNENWLVRDWIDCFVFILLLTIPFDFKDIEEDTRDQIKTFPMLSSQILRHLLMLVFLLFASFNFYLESEIGLLFVAALYAYFIYRLPTNRYTFYLVFDGLILLRGLFHLI